MSHSKLKQTSTIVRISSRLAIGCLLATSFNVVVNISAPMAALASCESPAQEGRWRNNNSDANPTFIDMYGSGGYGSECPDLTMRVWVKQSTGKFYGRPPVNMRAGAALGEKWLVGRVGTGGYIDNIWIREIKENGERKIRVLIVHESVDSKPSAQSEHSFTYQEKINFNSQGVETPIVRTVVVGRVRGTNTNYRTICDDARENPASRDHQELCQQYRCYQAQAARRRGSPAAPGLEQLCRAGEQ
jgi:hypothetical protein